ncbi:MAG: dihydrofolate reductase [Betaproteobacteria bacterium]|nr:dihydrofolate reductase [Betaproteobacteria bacterium]
MNLIVAHTRNRVIGLAGGMPWHLPADLAYFKRTTLGHPVIMGRKTFESIGRPLPGRRNVVVSGQADFAPAGVEVCRSLAEALRVVGDEVPEHQVPFVIGGASLYAAALPLAKRLYVTEIDAELAGDTFFPPLTPGEWREVSRELRPADAANGYDLAFVVLERV